MTLPTYNPIAQPDQTAPNRGYDIPIDAPPTAITLEQIDQAIIGHLTDVITPAVEVNGVLQQVPVVFVAPERWKTIQADGFMRDPDTGKAQTPVIIVNRTSIDRATMANPSNKYLEVVSFRGWNRRNVYDRFAVQNRITPSRQFRAVMLPDYVDISYDIVIWTSMVQHLNALIEQIKAEADEYWGPKDGYKFRTKIDDFATEMDLPADSERIIRGSCTMITHGYLLPERIALNYRMTSTNQERFTYKKVVIRETLVNSFEK
jgi:hypothetical protein